MSLFLQRSPERSVFHQGSFWSYPVNFMETLGEQLDIVDDLERRMMLNEPLENWQMKRLNNEIQIGCPLNQNFSPKDIKVSYDEKKHQICVKANKSKTFESDTNQESYQSEFQQNIVLPDDVDPNQIKACLSNNKHLLTIKAPLKRITHSNEQLQGEK
eukprot:CAMPEP_0117419570 /NCGR_PEP_ID=MMETSP0758-20121206/1099_1 /TAXON_ID=63605 /ORGANISM="Percolomonas cosmopolitus, Strain AE-1 (ATCC 50343)" /LENGTH=157 /DNA_ID=CAMNT_0005200701 /DNA_START=2743 /DNA_END=3213 /DNA_ORIENTATION=-